MRKNISLLFLSVISLLFSSVETSFAEDSCRAQDWYRLSSLYDSEVKDKKDAIRLRLVETNCHGHNSFYDTKLEQELLTPRLSLGLTDISPEHDKIAFVESRVVRRSSDEDGTFNRLKVYDLNTGQLDVLTEFEARWAGMHGIYKDPEERDPTICDHIEKLHWINNNTLGYCHPVSDHTLPLQYDEFKL